MPTYIEGFEIDAVLSEERTTESEITEHPVERGVSITDHARVKPKTISLDVIVSDTPVGALAERRGMVVEGLSGTPNVDISPGGDFIASDVARAWLEALQISRKPVLVTTEWVRPDGSRGYKAFDNMMIQSIGETITPETGDAFTCKVTFRQITYVTNERTVVNVVTRAKKKLDKGNKATEEKKTPGRRKTWAKTAKDSGVKLYKDVGGVSGLIGF